MKRRRGTHRENDIVRELVSCNTHTPIQALHLTNANSVARAMRKAEELPD